MQKVTVSAVTAHASCLAFAQHLNTMSLPLTVRKNIRDTEPKLKESLEKIAKITGKEWTMEVDWA